MRRAAIVVVLLAVIGALSFWWMNSRSAAPEGWLGYVEGEAIEIAASVSGTLARLDVTRGGQVIAGQPLFSLNAISSDAEIRRLEAQLAQAQAQRADLGKSRQIGGDFNIPAGLRPQNLLVEFFEGGEERPRLSQMVSLPG